MTYKWVGAVLVVLGCGGCGLRMVAEQTRQAGLLRQLLQGLEFMESQLQYRLTPLPELCRQAAGEVGGSLGPVLRELAQRLDGGEAPEVSACMTAVLSSHGELPGNLRRLLYQLGKSLGRFDLPGQIQGLRTVRSACQQERQRLEENKGERFRSIQTLACCAGAALVILFA
ncbi:MAG: stage III sporulation protein AB [Eubacteriales bacterium]|nr:stage III sporulation protein AB [Eubacteriales bacterium]